MPNCIRNQNADTVRLRRATPNDIEPMRRLERQAIGAAHWTTEQYRELFSREAAERVVIVAADESDDATVHGFLIARCLPEEWEIENVVVEANRRRQGIARSLIQELRTAAEPLGVISIILEVRESNLAAMRLYESIGFNREGRRKDYYHAPPEDALLYRLTLRLCDKIP